MFLPFPHWSFLREGSHFAQCEEAPGGGGVEGVEVKFPSVGFSISSRKGLSCSTANKNGAPSCPLLRIDQLAHDLI